MGINSPKGPDDSQGDVSIPELIRFIEDNRYVAGFHDLTTMGDDNIRRFKEILHLKPDATVQEIREAFWDAIDKTNALSKGQIEEAPGDLEDLKKITNSSRLKLLNLYVLKLAEQKAEVEKICANSEIREERTFSKEDILKLIVRFAMARMPQFETNNLKVSKIINNEQGDLLVLEVQTPNSLSNSGYQQISYTIKGRHENNQSGTTSIDRTFWDENDMPEGGAIIMEYLEGEWRFIS